jgi:hypothetical protein
MPRGRCLRRFNHKGTHSNTRCTYCGINSKAKTGTRCVKCRRRSQKEYKHLHGTRPRNKQRPLKMHTFPCGCTGILPQRGHSNKFASKVGNDWWRCRVSVIIKSSEVSATHGDYQPIKINTPHSLIREEMDKNICYVCEKPLLWRFGVGVTPHLHHDHETGEIYGFSHIVCNTNALRIKIQKLEKEIAHLKKAQSL